MLEAAGWFFQQLFLAFPNAFRAAANPGAWLSWLGGLETDGQKASLTRFIYYGASAELFFVILAILIVLTALGVWRGAVMWRAVRVLESVGNGFGRVFAWAGLIMVVQQILIVFLQRIFRVSEISVGPFGYIFTKDLSWYAEELKLYNAMIVCLCVSYTFVQGGHVRVDLFYSGAAHRTKRIIDMAGSLFFMLPAAVLIWLYSWFFMWRHLVTPKVSATDKLELLERKARILKWNVETIGFSPNGFNAYFLFKVLIVAFAGLVFIQGVAFFYRSFLEWREGEKSVGKHLDKDRLDEDAPAGDGAAAGRPD